MTLTSARPIFAPLYHLSFDTDLFSTWRQDERYVPQILPNVEIQQIETDRHNENVMYILSQYKGLYRSMDGGQSVELLALARDKMFEIESIVVDPNDGRVLFAVLGSRDLYRSKNYGCDWERIEIPR